jgi:hypothetical protein
MKLVALTQNRFAQVDDEDYKYLNQWKWWAMKRANTTYAGRKGETVNGKKTTIMMHRLLLKITDKNILCDHRDHDGLNNQKHNLRACSNSENLRNKISKTGSSSRFLGVSVYSENIKWILKNGEIKNGTNKRIIAQIRVNNKNFKIGDFKTEEDAARAYDAAAKIHYGEFANLNFK